MSNHSRHSRLHARLLRYGGACAALLLVAGCQQGDRSVGSDFLSSESSAHAIDRALLAQATAGAADDAMLFPVHFDGPVLNSLGEQKLRLMLEDPGFLLTPEVFVVSERTEHVDAVEEYFAQLGFQTRDIAVRSGPNPAAASPAALRIAQQAAMMGTNVEQVDASR